MKHLLKHEYPNLKHSQYNKALSFIAGKCSEYYFLDYMRCSNGNVDDAIKFYKIDDHLRILIFKHIIRFEIQLKSDFANSLYLNTHDANFWKRKKYYLPDAIVSRSKRKNSRYYLVKRKIETGINKLHYDTIGPTYLVAMYTCTFGTFQQLFRNIGKEYKESFILKYSTKYKFLNTVFDSIRIIRNRCAHGNHLISNKILFELYNLKSGIGEKDSKNSKIVFEKTLNFMFEHYYYGNQFKTEFLKLLDKNKILLLKYYRNHSIPSNYLNALD